MARPRIYEEPRVTTALRLTPEMRDDLRRAACDQGLSVNQLVVATLSEYLDKLALTGRPPAPRQAS